MNPARHVELDVDIGADAKDWSAIEAAEKLKPVETELRRIEETIQEVVDEMDYLRTREQKLRDTNESTNERVKWFALGTMGMLIGLGAWQVVYLRAYFRYAASQGSRARVSIANVSQVKAFDLSVSSWAISHRNAINETPTMLLLNVFAVTVNCVYPSSHQKERHQRGS